jgi:hemoglobin
MSKIQLLAVAVLVAVLPVTAGAQKAAKQASLYDRLGGKKAITAVVDEFVGRVAADDRGNGHQHSRFQRPR